MARKKLTEEQEKEIKLLQANNEMLERTKEEAKLRGNEKSVERIQIAQNDVIEQVKKIDATIAKEMTKGKRVTKSAVEEMMEAHKDENDIQSIFEVLEENKKNVEEISKVTSSTVSNEESYMKIPKVSNDIDFGDIDSDVQYDIIPLPSNGEGYSNKMGRVPVAYLTAYDENLITSPNLYKDGLIIDFLLKNKIMNKDIDIDELYSGDVDAIILFLRATSYGPEFPVSVRDPESGERIETVVDLSLLKPKEFNLKGDENGYFDFELPLSKDLVKFKFLTRKDEKNLQLLNKLENDALKSALIKNNVNLLSESVKSDATLSGVEKQSFLKTFDELNKWADTLKEKSNTLISKSITNRMEMSIVSVNGNSDKKFIAKYVHNMGTRDSLAFRKYLMANEPGIDFEVEIERPQNLGGGSFKTFLEWDDTVFLNIA